MIDIMAVFLPNVAVLVKKALMVTCKVQFSVIKFIPKQMFSSIVLAHSVSHKLSLAVDVAELNVQSAENTS